MPARGTSQRHLQTLAQSTNVASGKQPRHAARAGGARRLPPRLQAIIATIGAGAVLFACGLMTTTLTTAPAAQLYVDVKLQQALIPSAAATVQITIQVERAARVKFAGHQRLTVNGRDPDPSFFGGYRFTVPRAAPAGSYTIVYTDERGRQTSVVVLAPARDLAVTSPAAGTQIPIPQFGAQLAVQYTVPFPAPSPLSQLPWRTTIDAGAEGSCKAARSDGIPASAPSCISFFSYQPDVNGSAVVSDSEFRPGSGIGFDNLAPGPGALYVHMIVAGDLPPSGFAAVHVVYDDVASLPITWV